MSTPLILVNELCTLIEHATQDILLETKNGAFRAPVIIPGFFDEADSGEGKPSLAEEIERSVPYIIVRFLSGEEQAQAGSATIKIIVMTYAKQGQGWRDTMNILERIRQAIFRSSPLARQFNLQMPVKYEMPEDKPWPYFIAWMTTQWEIARPLLTEMEEGMYGEYE